ncbi:MAG: UDP-N-acetylmuramate dehydrogenase [Flavobacteriaceae bacterium TMED42]|nr:MAG: UDP-N-acetylenolpyruvoylglucosamine reductase [Kiritimatiellaceae bacterium TMED266]RPG64354.1 MAG: UDP-N-acetylmuramate dehydrogenase [Flavobacteriaceae bacterium TMED42]
MNFQKDISLRTYNTFGIDVKSKKFIGIQSTDVLKAVLAENQGAQVLLLGGGSNLLLTKDFDGLTIRIENRGIEILKEDEYGARIKVAAGENWHDFVLWCLKKDFGGVENLALIPGSVGAAPIQNIGAYGVELSQVFESCEAMSRETGEIKTFNKTECEFGYRNSIFKNTLKEQYIITSVEFNLTKAPHQINTSYGGLSEKIESKSPSIQTVAQTVIEIRSAKLPDPRLIGNSGSFFKNPVLGSEQFAALQQQHPNLPHYPDQKGKVKIPAAWLIDYLGFKGYRKNDAGVHQNQALVLVNYGNASGAEIKKLAQEIKDKVLENFKIDLEFEVNIL